MAFAVIGLVIALVGASISLIACLVNSAKQRRRFSAIVDVDAEVARLRSVAAQEIAQQKAAATDDLVRLKEARQRQEREAQDLMSQAHAEAARVRAAAAGEAEAIQRATQR